MMVTAGFIMVIVLRWAMLSMGLLYNYNQYFVYSMLSWAVSIIAGQWQENFFTFHIASSNFFVEKFEWFLWSEEWNSKTERRRYEASRSFTTR